MLPRRSTRKKFPYNGPMFTMECREGRLGELRFGAAFASSEMPMIRSRLLDIHASHRGKLVFCVDLRALDRFGPDEEKQLIALMQADNPRVERSAMLVNASGRFGLQVLKMIQEADNRARRVFREPAEVAQWLSAVLTPAESTRLSEFLLEVGKTT